MAPRNNDYDPDKNLISDVIGDALNFSPENEPGEPRDPAWLRWAKFAALMIVPAMIFSVAFGLGIYFLQSRYSPSVQNQIMMDDSMRAMRFRFVLGAVLGAALGGIYVVRCIVRKVDP
jgi:hypothetical protein